jgi:methionyl-tRNA synthetase
MAKFPASISGSLDSYRFREALNELMNLARLGNKYLTDQEPWKKFKEDPERVGTVLNLCMQICANLSILGEPFLPFTSQKINRLINTTDLTWASAGRSDLLQAGHQLNTPEFLFERIEDEAIEAQVAKLQQSKADNVVNSAVAVAPAKELVSYDDFSRMDIRIGTILAAEKVPKTKKLLKVTVDTGVDTRTIVSGIAEYYEPEDLVGKQACFLINLEPREIKGNVSNGMILMAEDANGRLALVSPAGVGFGNGSTVK